MNIIVIITVLRVWEGAEEGCGRAGTLTKPDCPLLLPASAFVFHAAVFGPLRAPLASPVLKWGGEGADNPAHCAPLDPSRRYRIRGRMQDEAYISFTVYTGKAEGDWNDGVASGAPQQGRDAAPVGFADRPSRQAPPPAPPRLPPPD